MWSAGIPCQQSGAACADMADALLPSKVNAAKHDTTVLLILIFVPPRFV